MNRRNGRGRSVAMAAALGAAACAGQARGQSWLSPAPGVWSDGKNWSGGTVPRFPGDVATIEVGGTPFDVTLDISVALSGFNLTSDDARLVGSGGSTMTVVDTLFRDASIAGLTGYSSTGTLIFAGDVCDDLVDTPLEHTGSAIEWTGAGDILLGDNSTLSNGAASVFNIENASRLFWDGGGVRSQLINNGKISKNSGGVTTFDGVAFTNNGAVCVLGGELQLIDVGLEGPSLQTGHWEVVGESTLNIARTQYDSLGGSVALDGAGSQFDAINTLATIEAGGAFEVRNGRDFTTLGNLAVAGSLVIGRPQLAPSDFTVTGDLGNNGRVHLGGGTLSVSGQHVIGANGVFSGSGTQLGDLTNNGLISPGEDTEGPSSPGLLVISSGIFEQGPDGRVLIEIGGLQPGLDFDVLRADVALFAGERAGVLEIRLIDGFTPSLGDTFDIFLFRERGGQFAEIEGLTQRGITFRAGFVEDALRLEVVAVPAPGGALVLGLAVAGASRRRRRA